ncbi:MAG: Calx-beta domain-containing protein, partial [Pseudohongiellaceae bacterium]
MRRVSRKFPCILSAVLLSILSPLTTSQTLPTLSISVSPVIEGEPMTVTISIPEPVASFDDRVRFTLQMGLTGDTAVGATVADYPGADYKRHGGGGISIHWTSTSWVYTVQTNDDEEREHYRETFRIRLSDITGAIPNPSQATGVANQMAITATILDNDLPEISLHLSDQRDPTSLGLTSVDEFTGGLEFWVQVQPPALDNLVVALKTLTLPAGDTSDIAVTIMAGTSLWLITTGLAPGNAIDGPDIRYAATLSTAAQAVRHPASPGPDGIGSYTLGTPHQLTVTVTDDDEPPGVSVSNTTVDENTQAPPQAGTLVFPINLTLESGFTTSISYATSNGTAMAGSDYTAAAGTLTFAPGESNKLVTLTILDDALTEGDETFTLRLSNPNFLTLGTSEATIIITDNEPRATLTINEAEASEGEHLPFIWQLSKPVSTTVTVDYATSNGTAQAGSDYAAAADTLTFQPGETTKRVSVAATADGATEHYHETFSLIPANLQGPVDYASPTYSNGITGTIIDIDQPTATISLTGTGGTSESSVPLVYTIHYQPATSHPTGSRVLLTWGNGNNSTSQRDIPVGSTSQTVSLVGLAQDNMQDGPDIAYTATLLPPAPGSTGGYNIGMPGTATVTLFDDDDPPSVSVTGDTNSEDNGTLVFSINIDTTSQFTTSVGYATSDGTAIAGTDYEAVSGRVTFQPKTNNAQVTVSILDDGITENDETFKLILSNPTRLTLGSSEATGTIIGDPPTLSITAPTVTEGEPMEVVISLFPPFLAERGVEGRVGVQLLIGLTGDT